MESESGVVFNSIGNVYSHLHSLFNCYLIAPGSLGIWRMTFHGVGEQDIIFASISQIPTLPRAATLSLLTLAMELWLETTICSMKARCLTVSELPQQNFCEFNRYSVINVLRRQLEVVSLVFMCCGEGIVFISSLDQTVQPKGQFY